MGSIPFEQTPIALQAVGVFFAAGTDGIRRDVLELPGANPAGCAPMPPPAAAEKGKKKDPGFPESVVRASWEAFARSRESAPLL